MWLSINHSWTSAKKKKIKKKYLKRDVNYNNRVFWPPQKQHKTSRVWRKTLNCFSSSLLALQERQQCLILITCLKRSISPFIPFENQHQTANGWKQFMHISTIKSLLLHQNAAQFISDLYPSSKANLKWYFKEACNQRRTAVKTIFCLQTRLFTNP